MKIAVWDTYVTRQDGKVMHFDILVEEHLKDENQIYEFGQTYLKSKSLEGLLLTSNECVFCHIEKASDAVELEILKRGFAIIEMENCY